MAGREDEAQASAPIKEHDMPKKLGWFDRLLIKVAVAKAAARGTPPAFVESLARSLKEAFAVIREP